MTSKRAQNASATWPSHHQPVKRACRPSGWRVFTRSKEDSLARGLDDPPRQPHPPQARSPEGGRPPGVVGVCGDADDRVVLRRAAPADRVAVKPHASPVFHAIQYLFGRQTREKLKRFRALGGAQSYPSRTKDADDVDFSTGSVGLGVAMTSFAALVQRLLHAKEHGARRPAGRMVAMVGDAELDEGNVFEALLEGWKHDVRNVWWVIDYNRQSLDAMVTDRLFQRHGHRVPRHGLARRHAEVRAAAWRTAFAPRGGDALQGVDRRVSRTSLYSALAYPGRRGLAGAADRRHRRTSGIRELARRARRRRAARADDEPGRARSRDDARGLRRRRRRSADLFHRLHHQGLSGCRSPGTRTITAG